MIKAIFVFLIVVSFSVNGYELGTHSRITLQAFLKSELTNGDALLSGYGLANINVDEPFGNAYYDISDSNIIKRNAKTYSTIQNRMPGNEESLSIQGWVMRGAIREDDVCITSFFQSHCDGPSAEVRVLNHFYDPINDRPLNVGGIPVLGAEKATNWAVGSADAYGQPITPDPNRQNHFSLTDAREAMFRALTEYKSSGPVEGLDKLGHNGETAVEAIRNTYIFANEEC